MINENIIKLKEYTHTIFAKSTAPKTFGAVYIIQAHNKI
jgi:hypothetical protein